MAQSLKELLEILDKRSKQVVENYNGNTPHLENSSATWRRIWTGDSFAELNLGKSELEDFLEDWKSSNPYNNI